MERWNFVGYRTFACENRRAFRGRKICGSWTVRESLVDFLLISRETERDFRQRKREESRNSEGRERSVMIYDISNFFISRQALRMWLLSEYWIIIVFAISLLNYRKQYFSFISKKIIAVKIELKRKWFREI